jgi:hypothetical protein
VPGECPTVLVGKIAWAPSGHIVRMRHLQPPGLSFLNILS